MFFDYRQNNSGGSFITDSDVDVYVIIEAANADEANEIAQEVGIYFDGCHDGTDCPCCGDRWYAAYGEGDEVPSLYGESLDLDVGNPYYDVIIYYLDGRKVRV